MDGICLNIMPRLKIKAKPPHHVLLASEEFALVLKLLARWLAVELAEVLNELVNPLVGVLDKLKTRRSGLLHMAPIITVDR